MCKYHFKVFGRGVNYSQKRLFSPTKANTEPSLHGIVQSLWPSNRYAAAFEYFNFDSAPAQYSPEADFNVASEIVIESSNTCPVPLCELILQCSLVDNWCSIQPHQTQQDIDYIKQFTL